MAQLSRPYQIGLAAVAVLAAAWLLLLRGHSESSTSSSGSAPTVQHTASTHASAPSATGTAGQAAGSGSASSLGSLGHAVEKARGAVTTSQQNAKQLEERSNQASSATPSTSSSTSSSAATTSTKPTTSTTKAPAKTQSKSTTSPSAHSKTQAATARQHAVEAELKQGKIAVILFWDPKGADDRSVHGAVRSLQASKLKVAINEASPGEVASFGTITRGVQVYGTPTLLIVNEQGKVRTLTGLQDSYAIAQAIGEARHS